MTRKSLATISTNGFFAESYTYDPLGRRISTTNKEGTEYHVYDGHECVADTDVYGNILRSYTWGTGIDNLLAITVYSAGGVTNSYYAIKDHLGSVHAFVDEAGMIVESYEYDAWGRVVSASGGNSIGNRYLWQGREYSFATGLYNFRARWYDPETGRWISKDPIGIEGGLNLYAFCGNNPVNFTDPLGEDWLDNVSNFSAGFADHITFGGTEWLRDKLNSDGDPVDTCSDAYKGGTYAGWAYDAAWTLRGLAGLGKDVLANSKWVGKGSKLFGRGGEWGSKGILNNSDKLRTGWSWKGTAKAGQDVFRTSWGKAKSYWNHLDWF